MRSPDLSPLLKGHAVTRMTRAKRRRIIPTRIPNEGGVVLGSIIPEAPTQAIMPELTELELLQVPLHSKNLYSLDARGKKFPKLKTLAKVYSPEGKATEEVCPVRWERIIRLRALLSSFLPLVLHTDSNFLFSLECRLRMLIRLQHIMFLILSLNLVWNGWLSSLCGKNGMPWSCK
jgi:hypothetical protein